MCSTCLRCGPLFLALLSRRACCTLAGFIQFPDRLRVELIANSANRFEEHWGGGVGLQFSAKATHTRVDTTRRDEEQVSPYGIKQCISRKLLSLMVRHVVDQPELKLSSWNFLSTNDNSHCRRIDDKHMIRTR